MNRTILLITSFLIGVVSAFAQAAFNAPGTGNPVIPGYFADPTIKKFGDTYYMYATTDGSGAGFGPAQVWTSKDFVNWTLMPMNWPDSHWIWAPDVMQHSDGKYYYFYCQPCIIHCGVSETPRGPWKNILGDSEAVLIPDRFVTNAITLDGQTFVDDDGSVYMYWGTWGIYKGFGLADGSALRTEMDAVRRVLCDLEEAVLDAKDGVLQAEIEGGALLHAHSPDRFSLGHRHRQPQGQPGLAHLG